MSLRGRYTSDNELTQGRREEIYRKLDQSKRRFHEFARTVMEEDPEMTREDVRNMLLPYGGRLLGNPGPKGYRRYHITTVHRKLSGRIRWTFFDCVDFLRGTTSFDRFEEWFEQEMGDG